MAYEFLKEMILPILNKPEKFKDEAHRYLKGTNGSVILYKLTEGILLFRQRNVNEPMDKLVALIKEHVSAANMKPL